MTTRPFFSPKLDSIGVEESFVSFAWSPGFAISQKQKNVDALHAAILAKHPRCKPLEVSSKSLDDIGVKLSAFNLSIPFRGENCSVESIFQASKVFEFSGPFPDLYTHDSREVRGFVRGNAKGALVAFEANGTRWPLNPTRAFYDWIYIKALVRNPELANAVMNFDCFTDIEFNPRKSLNCQAYAVALYRSFVHAHVLEEALSSKEAFLRFHPNDIISTYGGVIEAASSEQLLLGL